MTYNSYTDHRSNTGSSVPFFALVEPLSFVGETVYWIVESAVRAAHQAYEIAKTKVLIERSIRTLEALDDHILQDIGINRCEIPHLARKMAENPRLDYRTHQG